MITITEMMNASSVTWLLLSFLFAVIFFGSIKFEFQSGTYLHRSPVQSDMRLVRPPYSCTPHIE